MSHSTSLRPVGSDMLFLSSVASDCFRVRTSSTARLTAVTSIAAAVTIVVAGGGMASGLPSLEFAAVASPCCGSIGAGLATEAAALETGLGADLDSLTGLASGLALDFACAFGLALACWSFLSLVSFFVAASLVAFGLPAADGDGAGEPGSGAASAGTAMAKSPAQASSLNALMRRVGANGRSLPADRIMPLSPQPIALIGLIKPKSSENAATV